MRLLQMPDVVRYRTMTTEELRGGFLVDDLFQPGRLNVCYVDLDRTVIGSAVPLDDPLRLPTYPALRADYFLERRELGVLNIGGRGSVAVDGETFTLDSLDGLYVGRGSKEVVFNSKDPHEPAEFYLLSYPAHAVHVAQVIRSAQEAPVHLGAAETANKREITKLIHFAGVRSCQLVMGFTRLAAGSVWNTMPPHTHMRRSEVYLYFHLADTDRVVHLMGPAEETRHIVVANKQAVVSPGWSIHAGVGTTNYAFCWGMGGENQDYADMDPIAVPALR